MGLGRYARLVAFRFGVALDFGTHERSLHDQLVSQTALAQHAERLGFCAVAAGENFQPAAFHLPSALLVLATLAQSTSSLQLCTGVALLPGWDPWKLALDAAQLDQLSGGRVALGVGIGNPTLWASTGWDRATAAARTDETLAALKALWGGAPGYSGAHVKVDRALPVLACRDGGPLLWIGGGLKRSAERAAEVGDAFYVSSNHLRHHAIRLTEHYYAALSSAGKAAAMGTVVANRITLVADSADEARDLGRRYLAGILANYARIGSFGDERRERPGEAIFDELGDQVSLVGTPEQVLEQVQAYRRAGIAQIQARVSPEGMPREVAERSLELLAEEVLPALT